IDELVAQKVQEILGSDPRIAEVQSLAATQAEEAQFSQIEQDFDVKLTAKDGNFVSGILLGKELTAFRSLSSLLIRKRSLAKRGRDSFVRPPALLVAGPMTASSLFPRRSMRTSGKLHVTQ